ncbi:hypothetical protein BC828DRAFT_377633 [Blastocladiella britannica]|nr:hypothetical protein BC828DRAFT_377633 [Blastocladiella britannica]
MADTPFVFGWECFLMGLVIPMDLSTSVQAYHLWQRTEQSGKMGYYLILSIACVAHMIGFITNLLSYLTDYLNAAADPVLSKQWQVWVIFAVSQSYCVTQLFYVTGFQYVNGKRLLAIGRTIAPRTTYTTLVLLCASVVTGWTVNVGFLVTGVQQVYYNDDSLLNPMTFLYTTWATADSILMVFISMVFVWCIHRLSIQSHATPPLPVTPTPPSSHYLRKTLGLPKASPHKAAQRHTHVRINTLPEHFNKYLPERLQAHLQTPMSRLLFTLFTILPVECAVMIAANIICQLKLLPDQTWSTVLFAESVRLRLFCVFLKRMTTLMRSRRRTTRKLVKPSQGILSSSFVGYHGAPEIQIISISKK